MGILPFHPQRATPYLYSEEEIRRLMEAARSLPPSGGLRGLTYHCLFGLLTVTGLRISEALALTREDVDLRNGLLTIRGAKFAKHVWSPYILPPAVLSRATRSSGINF